MILPIDLRWGGGSPLGLTEGFLAVERYPSTTTPSGVAIPLGRGGFMAQVDGEDQELQPQPSSLVQPGHQIQTLHRRPAGAFAEVVEQGDQADAFAATEHMECQRVGEFA